MLHKGEDTPSPVAPLQPDKKTPLSVSQPQLLPMKAALDIICFSYDCVPRIAQLQEHSCALGKIARMAAGRVGSRKGDGNYEGHIDLVRME